MESISTLHQTMLLSVYVIYLRDGVILILIKVGKIYEKNVIVVCFERRLLQNSKYLE